MLFFLLPVVVVCVLDRWTKFLVLRHMVVGESRPVLGEFFHITSVRNTGAAFGMFAGNSGVFVWISLVAIALVLYLYFRGGRGRRLRSLALGCILGGALGNVFDRIRYHEVVDFLEFTFGSYHFAVFNVADAAVTVGVILLAFEIYFRGPSTGHESHESAAPAGP